MLRPTVNIQAGVVFVAAASRHTNSSGGNGVAQEVRNFVSTFGWLRLAMWLFGSSEGAGPKLRKAFYYTSS
jgi:hypothetical protein